MANTGMSMSLSPYFQNRLVADRTTTRGGHLLYQIAARDNLDTAINVTELVENDIFEKNIIAHKSVLAELYLKPDLILSPSISRTYLTKGCLGSANSFFRPS